MRVETGRRGRASQFRQMALFSPRKLRFGFMNIGKTHVAASMELGNDLNKIQFASSFKKRTTGDKSRFHSLGDAGRHGLTLPLRSSTPSESSPSMYRRIWNSTEAPAEPVFSLLGLNRHIAH